MSDQFLSRTNDWTSKSRIETAPVWCSTDLSGVYLMQPDTMDIEKKIDVFWFLVKSGFKEIAVGCPSDVEADEHFLARITKRNILPEDVRIQVMTRVEPKSIRKTFEQIRGIKKAAIDLYEWIPSRQNMSPQEYSEYLEQGLSSINLVNELLDNTDQDIRIQFTSDISVDKEDNEFIRRCNFLARYLHMREEQSIVVNIQPDDMYKMPHVFAGEVAWVRSQMQYPEKTIISIRPCSLSGTSLSLAEEGILAGAERIEGTILGNAANNGSADILMLSRNMKARGLSDIGLNLPDSQMIRELMRKSVKEVLKTNYGINLPEKMVGEVDALIKDVYVKVGKELTPDRINQIFSDNYLNAKSVFVIDECHFKQMDDGIIADATIQHGTEIRVVSATGNGRLDAVSNAIKQYFNISYELRYYEEHSLTRGSSSRAVAYVGVILQGKTCWGVGIDADIIKASIEALLVAVNKLEEIQEAKTCNDERMLEILSYIQNNYVDVTLDSLSERFYLSKPYLSKYIKEKSGKTFGEQVRRIRMKKARALLKSSSMTVETIAITVGYQNVEHFNRIFKKMYHMTPIQFRNMK